MVIKIVSRGTDTGRTKGIIFHVDDRISTIHTCPLFDRFLRAICPAFLISVAITIDGKQKK